MRYFYRVSFRKLWPMNLVSHLDMMNAIMRAIRRARLPVEYSRGQSPHPRIAMGPALPLGVESYCELFDIILTLRLRTEDLKERLNSVLPSGLVINGAVLIPPEAPSIPLSLGGFIYSVELRLEGAEGEDARNILTFLMEKVAEDKLSGFIITDVFFEKENIRFELHQKLRDGNFPGPVKFLKKLLEDAGWPILEFGEKERKGISFMRVVRLKNIALEETALYEYNGS